MALTADQKAMLQLLLERGQSYDDLASILGVEAGEVRTRARGALTELAGTDPDRNAALTDYLLGQADPIDRADAVRHLKDDPEDLALINELAQKLRLLAPEAELPKLPGSERQPRPRGSARRRAPKPLRRILPSPSGAGEKRQPRTTLTRRQAQGIALLGCVAVLLAVGALAIAGVFSSEPSADSRTTATTTADNNNPVAGKVQGYPLAPIRLTDSGSFSDTIPIPDAVQPLLSQVQAVAITLANNRKVAQSIDKAVRSQTPALEVEGKTSFIGVVGARKGKVFPIKLVAGKDVKGSGDAALGIANQQPFFQVKLNGLEQPPKGSSYIIWLVLGQSQGS